jgi:hypothetical protein
MCAHLLGKITEVLKKQKNCYRKAEGNKILYIATHPEGSPWLRGQKPRCDGG